MQEIEALKRDRERFVRDLAMAKAGPDNLIARRVIAIIERDISHLEGLIADLF